MTEDIDSRYRRILSKQLAMNPETWARLEAHGVTAETMLRLEFSYHAPSVASAESLRAVLADETDYDIRIENIAASESAPCMLLGATQSTTISLEILDQWVNWMVTAGLHEDCEFDGWGVQV